MNAFIIADPRLCIGCNTCMAACSDVHRQQGLQTAPRLHVIRNATDSAPVTCHQCEDAPCALVCPVNAIRMTDNAIGLDENACVSCRLCGIACPFGSITFSGSTPLAIPAGCNSPLAPPAPLSSRPFSDLLNGEPGLRVVAVKCDLCAFSTEGPACVRTCPTQAIRLVGADAVRYAGEQKRRQALQTTLPFIPFSSRPEESDS